jgi:hypothetical protein
MKITHLLNGKSILLLFVSLYCNHSFAQNNSVVMPQKTLKKNFGVATKINLIAPQFTFDVPLLDQAKRFGLSNKLGAGFYTKSKNNWIYGGSMQFIFGNKIVEDSFLWNVRTPQNDLITVNGDFQAVGVFQRGYIFGFEVGKVLPIAQLNANSGIMVSSQLGYMRHRINIFDRDNLFPQFEGDLRKGYDRLTHGGFLEAFVGYLYLSQKRKINGFAGFNFIYGATKGQRNFLYDVAKSGLGNRQDATLGFKLGWIIPIYKKAVEERYY